MRLQYERKQIQSYIARTTKAFDEALMDLRREKVKLDGGTLCGDDVVCLLFVLCVLLCVYMVVSLCVSMLIYSAQISSPPT